MFLDETSRLVYENLCKLRDTGNISFLLKAHEACGITSDPAYSFHLMLKEKQREGRMLILYGLGKTVESFLEVESKRENTVGYLYFPFLGGVSWDGVYDKNPEKYGKKEWRHLSWEELYEVRENALICVSTSKYYKEISDELQRKGFPKENIISYIYPSCQLYEDKQYYDDFLVPHREEIVIDGGCYRCDTIERFLKWNQNMGYGQIISFEPDKYNYAICEDIIKRKGWQNIKLIHAGLSDTNMKCSMVSNGDDTSYICPEEGNETVNLTTIDDVVGKTGKVSFIKLDVEGFELEALKGAKETIQKEHPRMAISLYHKLSDIEEIPKYITELSSEYKFYLRIYSNEYLEIVLYAI